MTQIVSRPAKKLTGGEITYLNGELYRVAQLEPEEGTGVILLQLEPVANTDDSGCIVVPVHRDTVGDIAGDPEAFLQHSSRTVRLAALRAVAGVK